MQALEQWQEELEYDPPIHGTRPLYDIYQICNVAICEPTGYEKAIKDHKWKKPIDEKMSIIQQKNKKKQKKTRLGNLLTDQKTGRLLE